MPIKKELYPADWREISAAIRFGRAQGRCEGCGRTHGALVMRNGKIRHIWLTTAHLNHDPSDNRDSNLKAWCQRCHLAHDRSEHQRRRRITYRKRRAIGDLFLGRY